MTKQIIIDIDKCELNNNLVAQSSGCYVKIKMDNGTELKSKCISDIGKKTTINDRLCVEDWDGKPFMALVCNASGQVLCEGHVKDLYDNCFTLSRGEEEVGKVYMKLTHMADSKKDHEFVGNQAREQEIVH